MSCWTTISRDESGTYTVDCECGENVAVTETYDDAVSAAEDHKYL